MKKNGLKNLSKESIGNSIPYLLIMIRRIYHYYIFNFLKPHFIATITLKNNVKKNDVKS